MTSLEGSTCGYPHSGTPPSSEVLRFPDHSGEGDPGSSTGGLAVATVFQKRWFSLPFPSVLLSGRASPTAAG